MFSTLFSSIGLQICGLTFLIFVTIMFLFQKKEKNYSIKSYKILLFITYLVSFLEIITYVLFDKFGDVLVTILFAKLFIVGLILWFGVFCFYLTSKFIIKDIDENKSKAKKIIIIDGAFSLILLVIALFLNVGFHGSGYNEGIYVINGNYLIVMYIAVLIGFIIMIYSLLSRFKELDMIQKISLMFLQISFIAFVIFEFIANKELSNITYVFIIYVISFYFTIEETDYKQIITLTTSKQEAEIINANINSVFDNLSINTINSLNNIFLISNYLNYKKDLNVDELKEKINLIEMEKNKVISQVNSNFVNLERRDK